MTDKSSSFQQIDPSTVPLPKIPTQLLNSRPRFQNASPYFSLGPGPPPATSSHSTATTSISNTTIACASPLHDTRAGPQNPEPSWRRSTLSSLSFPLFQLSNNASVTSLVPSTAEGRPIPLDDSTAAHRTSALRELNSNFPSPVNRHRYSTLSGPQSSTCNEPVIVRTYSRPAASQGHSRSSSQSARRRGSPPDPSTFTSHVSPVAHSRPATVQQLGGILSMRRGNVKKVAWPWRQGQEREALADRLPPYEAYSFNTIMANLQAQSNEVDRALDGIAEIYACSRYSLSNQYEVHVTPYGSGASFTSSVPSSSRRREHTKNHHHSQSGLTLQAIQSDDDENSAGVRSHSKHRNAGRRRSAAHSTLETIMSSSRSSEGDRTKKESASGLAAGVLYRVASNSKRSDVSGSSQTGSQGDVAKPEGSSPKRVARGISKPFANAIIYADTNKIELHGEGPALPRTSSVALVSEPSMPQTSIGHVEIRTTPSEPFRDAPTQASRYLGSPDASDPTHTQLLQPLTSRVDSTNKPSNSGLMSWMPWKSSTPGPSERSQHGSTTAGTPSHAEVRLRELLKNVDYIYKGNMV